MREEGRGRQEDKDKNEEEEEKGEGEETKSIQIGSQGSKIFYLLMIHSTIHRALMITTQN
jgi:hypothetical protein